MKTKRSITAAVLFVAAVATTGIWLQNAQAVCGVPSEIGCTENQTGCTTGTRCGGYEGNIWRADDNNKWGQWSMSGNGAIDCAGYVMENGDDEWQGGLISDGKTYKETDDWIERLKIVCNIN